MGVDPAALADLVRAAEEARTGSLVVLKDGQVLVERHFRRSRRAGNIQSITKAITTLAVLLLLEEKKLELDALASTWFPEWAEDDVKRRVTLRHLLTHTSGIPTKTAELNEARDLARVAREQRAIHEPGSVWEYSNCGLQLVGQIVAAAAGRPIAEGP